MLDDEPAIVASAVELVVSTLQPDDSGAETADRYDWQAAMAAAHGLRLLYDALSNGPLSEAPFCRIICELHEDWVVCVDDDAELVSGKHRERSFGAYTTATMLVTKGGFGHLFGRWCALREQPTCRLVTTAGVKNKAKDLISAASTLRSQRLSKTPMNLDGDQKAAVDDFVKCLLEYKAGENESGLPEAWTGTKEQPVTAPTQAHTEQAMRFLAILEVDSDPPMRKEVAHAAPTMYVVPVLRLLGLGETRAVEVWNTVLGLFRERMRAAGPTPHGALPLLMQWRPAANGQADDSERDLISRIVTISDIVIAIELAATAITTSFSPPPTLPPTRLGLKMAAGGCSDNAIERGEQLCSDYREFWRAKEEVDHSARFKHDSTRRLLLRISDEATEAVRQPDQQWGPRLWTEIQSRIGDTPVARWPEQMDEELALGGICDLSSRCQVWFSDRFDVETAMRHTQEGQVA